jgi:uncharacterized protein YbjQ (UPF0145 family)
MVYINQFTILLFLLLLGVTFGRMAEKKHYKSIIKREKELNRIPAASTRMPPDIHYNQVLVSGNVVVANDYFKLFVAGLKSLFGGQLNTYESLLDRGRREAILRMKQKASELNAELVINVKLTTTNLAMSQGKKSGSLEVYAYGTALIAK